MANITGASLDKIYNRLNGVSEYHPVSAETFSDWSLEAGDTVTITRDGNEYTSPVHTSSMVWNGKAQKITVNSTGNEERDAISKVSKSKYSSGTSGLRNSEKLYGYEVNQEHLLYEVYDTRGRMSKLEVTARGLYHEVYDTNGKFSKLKNTADGLYHEVYGTNGRFSKLKNTADGLFHEVYGTNGRFSKLKNTADGLYHEVYGTNGKFSKLKNTADGLYHEVYDTNGKFSKLKNTADGLYHEVYDTNGKFSKLQNTANGLYHEVYDTNGKFSKLKNTADGLYHEVYDTNGKFSKLQNTANGLYHEVYDTNGRFSKLQNTANGLYHEVYDTNGRFSKLQNTANGLYHEVYDTNGRFSKLQNTADGLYHEVYDTNGKFSKLKNTADGLYHEVYDTNGKFSKLKNTADGLYHEVYDTNGKFSKLKNTADGLYHEVYDTNGKFSKLQNTANGLYHEVYDTNGKFSTLQNTANGLYHEVYDEGTGLKSQIQSQAGRISLVVTDTDNPSIKPAAIVSSINSSGSSVLISANKIQIDGNTTVGGMLQVDGSDLVVTNNLYTGLNGSNYIQAKKVRLVGASSSQGANISELTESDVSEMIIKADVDGNTLKLWKHGDSTSGNPTWTFSKAVSLSDGWSGTATNSKTYAVTATMNGSQVGSPKSVTIWQLFTGSAQDSTFNAEFGDYNGNNFISRGVKPGYLVTGGSGTSSYVDMNSKADGTGYTYARLGVGSIYTAGYEYNLPAGIDVSSTSYAGTQEPVNSTKLTTFGQSYIKNNFSGYGWIQFTVTVHGKQKKYHFAFDNR